MANVYSELIAELHDIGGPTPVVLDPTYIWVVRDICIYFPSPNTLCNAQIVAYSTSCTFYSVTDNDVGNGGDSFHWEGRQVFVPPADLPTLVVKASTALGGADVRISGYRLTPP